MQTEMHDMTQHQTIVAWTEVPVTDMTRACDFYSKVFGWKMEINNEGPNPMAVFDGRSDAAGGHIYPGTPGQGPTVHFALRDSVEAAADRVAAAGGTVMGPIVDIPAGRFQYATDPDGNSIGLFQPNQG